MIKFRDYSLIRLKHWTPVVSFFPLKDFPERLLYKLFYIAKNVFAFIGNRLGILGSKKIGTSLSGNSLLRLNKSYALGCKGSILELPEDKIIYKFVLRKGYWELEECEFLAHGLKKASRQSSKTALLDIGANTGLVTLQAINLSNTNNDVFLFEPVPRHARAIQRNLKDLRNIHINEFALSDRNGEAEIFTEATNHGNTSLLKSIVPRIGMVTTPIKLVETRQYCNEFLNGFEKYIIKCDTQGMDALILSRIPERIWKNCESAVIEVWSLSEVEKRDVDGFLSMCQEFEYVSWHPKSGKEMRIELDEVNEFWLSKTGVQRNLFLSKSI